MSSDSSSDILDFWWVLGLLWLFNGSLFGSDDDEDNTGMNNTERVMTQTIDGEVKEVIDSNTVKVQKGWSDDYKTVDLANIHAPRSDSQITYSLYDNIPSSKSQCMETEAKNTKSWLKDKIGGKSVTVKNYQPDKELGSIFKDGTDIQREMVQTGYAKDLNGDYSSAQRSAQFNGRGIWNCREFGN